MNLKNIHNVYFVGIGGIGMSALALYFNAIDKHVAGYDKTKTAITDNLETKGVEVHFEDSIANLGDRFMNPETTLVVLYPCDSKRS